MVGTDPGSSELMTLGAVKTLQKCPVIFYPVTQSKSGQQKSRALETVKGAVDLGKKILLPLGRDEKIKKNLAEKLAEVASRELGREIEHFSVFIEDVPQDEWKEKVYDKVADSSNKNVFVKPGYTM